MSSRELGARLLAALEASRLATPRLVVVTVPAPLVSTEAVFECHPEDSAHYFANGETEGEAGLGVATSVEADNLDDLTVLEQLAEDQLRDCFEVGLDASARPPRFYGAITFEQAPSKTGPWHAFARLGFRLPRYRYVRDAKAASLSLAVLPEEIATEQQRQGWVAKVLHTLDEIGQPSAESYPPTRVLDRHECPTREQWVALVERARDAMRLGHLEKVVLAREIRLTLEHTPRPAAILRRLGELVPETTRFAFRVGSSVFLGATPERLVLRVGSDIRTEALAGSIRALDGSSAERLLASDKDLYEHRLVVQELDRKLTELGAVPQYPTRPQVRQLRHVVHLSTPILARAFGPPHVLSLAVRLHPTPAVGGVPEAAARQFIAEHEGFERGLYSGVVGWFDAAGDGEMLVALRSGLLEGRSFRLYAGAGIVKSSVSATEFEETELKCESLLEALDLATTRPND